MDFYIKIKDGLPFDHPIAADNFKQAFPSIDVNSLPIEFAKFERVEQPTLGPYEVNEGVTYEWVGDIVRDVWHIRQMTDQEKQEKINLVLSKKPFASWVFDEELCISNPPIKYPDDGKRYIWDESLVNWVLYEKP